MNFYIIFKLTTKTKSKNLIQYIDQLSFSFHFKFQPRLVRHVISFIDKFAIKRKLNKNSL